MLEEKDIEKIIEANKKVFATKEDFQSIAGIAKDVQGLVSQVNKLTDKVVSIESTNNEIKENMATKDEVNRLRNSVDAYVKQSEDSKQEYHMLENQVDQHDKWLQKIAVKTKLKLEY